MVELAPVERRPALEDLRTKIIQQVGFIEGSLSTLVP